MSRMPTDQLFMSWAILAAERGTCQRAKVGCVIVSERRPIAAGYVGSPPGQAHCTDVGCEIGPSGGCIRTTHAEANAIAFAARSGISIQGATLYSTHCPCRSCSQLLIAAGITEIHFLNEYRDDGASMLTAVGVKLVKCEARPWQHPFIGYHDQTCLLCDAGYHEHSN